MPRMLIFDIWGRYAHYKKIYATTSALSYIIPSKISLYGYVGALIGLDKVDNAYLRHFEPGQCRMGLQVKRPIVMQRISTNLHPHDKGLITARQNRKPTTVEYVYRPKYRVFFAHEDATLMSDLEQHLQSHTAVYTPTLGLAYLLSDFQWVACVETEDFVNPAESVEVDSVLPLSAFVRFDLSRDIDNEIVEYSQYPIEMNTIREVTQRTDVLIDRNGRPIRAQVKHCTKYQYNGQERSVILF